MPKKTRPPLPWALLAALPLALCATAPAAAQCLSDTQAAALVDSYLGKTPATNPPPMNEADGNCSRRKVNALLQMQFRQVVGYKAGLTNAATQRRFNHDKPVWGVLYEGMLLDDGATVDAAFGARPLYEADLLVRVKSEAINVAKTPAEVLAAIDQVIPFIELPDLLVQAPPQLNGPAIAAINVGARLGVMGKPLPVPATRAERFALLDGLRDMAVTIRDGNGAEVARGKGSDLLDHPLNAVVWLAGALKAEGLAMKPGELISLGSFTPLLPPKPGMKAVVSYDGLPGAVPVSVSFR